MHIIIIALVITTIDAYGLWSLKEAGVVARFQFVDELQVVKPQYKKADLSYCGTVFPEGEPLTIVWH